MAKRESRRARRKIAPGPIPTRFDSAELDLVNAMDRGLDPYTVAVAALQHAALTRRPIPDYLSALKADAHADIVLAALYRRGMVDA
jgi:hypothetical protein